MSLVHPDDIDWFMTLDETHHELTTVGNKSGSTTTRFANPSFPRSGDRVVETSGHITGVYAFTLRGEPLPPLYIFSSAAECEDNMKLSPEVCEGLPTVEAKYAQDSIFNHPSRTVIRKKGSMDTSLWHELHRKVYLPCGYKDKLSPTPVRDPVTNKLITGPLIIKTDAGPGRLSKEAASIEFREEMANLGVHILLSLPNGTECQAELDQMFSEFKPRCRRSTIRVAGMKMAARVAARKNSTLDAELDSNSGSDSDNDSSCVNVLKKKRSICNVSLSASDLSNVVNGFPGDPLELRPFDFCFTKDKIIKTWINVGFLPMTGNAALDPKVRYELGVGGAPAEARNQMETLQAEYASTSKELTEKGYNGKVLNLELPVVRNATLLADEDATVDHIVKNRLINKAGGLFKAGILIANSRAVLRAAKLIAEEDKQKALEAAQKKKDRQETLQSEAMMVFGRWKADGRKSNDDGPQLKKSDALVIIRVLLPRLDVKKEVKIGDLKTVKDCVQWLGGIRKGTTWDEEMEALEMEWEEAGLDAGL